MLECPANTQVVILAGGLGTRLRPITEKIPKPLVEVCEHPFLYWQLLDLQRQGFRRVLLLTGYLGEQIEAYFGSGFGSDLGIEVTYSRETQPLGTGGALLNAISLLAPTFVLLNGDSYLEAPLEAMLAARAEFKAGALVSTFERCEEVPVIPNIRAQKGRLAPVTSYQKDAGLQRGFDLIDSGVYIMSLDSVRDQMIGQEKQSFQLADLWPPLIESKQLFSYPVEEKFYDIGTAERLAEFEKFLRNRT